MQKTSSRMRTLAVAVGVTAALAYSVHHSGVDTAPAWSALGYAPAHAAEGETPAKPGGRHRGAHGWGHGMWFFKDLKLTPAQQAELKAMHADLRQQMATRKPDLQTGMTQLKQAFLADRFDAAALKAQLQAAHAGHSAEMTQKMAANLIRVYQLLTPEQRQQVLERLNQMETKAAEWQQKSAARQGDKPTGGHLQALAAKLNLSDAQKEQVAVLWKQAQPQHSERFQQAKALKQQVLAELQAPQPSASKLAQILTPMVQQMGQGMARHVDQMAALHAILTPQQRQQMVTLMETKAQRPHHGRRGPGKPQAQ